MIHIEHANLVVSDIEATLVFYRAAFPHWRVRDSAQGEWSGKPYTWLHFGDDYQYLTFNDHGEGPNRDPDGHQVGLGHLGFVVDSLDSMIERLARAGFTPSSSGASAAHRRNVYYIDPAGFEVEFVQYLSDLPSERNMSV